METVLVQCCFEGCGHSPFPMSADFERRARRTHEFWHCPAGHRQHWVGKTDEQVKYERVIESLRNEIAWLEGDRDWWRELAMVCPWPTCRERIYASRDSLFDHMRRIHGMPVLAEVRDSA